MLKSITLNEITLAKYTSGRKKPLPGFIKWSAPSTRRLLINSAAALSVAVHEMCNVQEVVPAAASSDESNVVQPAMNVVGVTPTLIAAEVIICFLIKQFGCLRHNAISIR